MNDLFWLAVIVGLGLGLVRWLRKVDFGDIYGGKHKQ